MDQDISDTTSENHGSRCYGQYHRHHLKSPDLRASNKLVTFFHQWVNLIPIFSSNFPGSGFFFFWVFRFQANSNPWKFFVFPWRTNSQKHLKIGYSHKQSTLLEINISPKKGTFEDDFPFPQVGYVNSLEGSLPLFSPGFFGFCEPRLWVFRWNYRVSRCKVTPKKPFKFIRTSLKLTAKASEKGVWFGSTPL